MATGDRKDPYLGFNFAVEVDSIVVAGFSEVSGLQSEAEVHEYREGGVNEIHSFGRSAFRNRIKVSRTCRPVSSTSS